MLSGNACAQIFSAGRTDLPWAKWFAVFQLNVQTVSKGAMAVQGIASCQNVTLASGALEPCATLQHNTTPRLQTFYGELPALRDCHLLGTAAMDARLPKIWRHSFQPHKRNWCFNYRSVHTSSTSCTLESSHYEKSETSIHRA